MTQTTESDSIRLIKKYPNRRLYDTHTSAYITLVDVKQLVMASEGFTVVDVKSNEDITRSILLQIILEEESANVPMFSATALEHIIRFYGSAMQGVMGTYLEKNIQAFIDMQSHLAEQSQGLYGKQLGPEAWAQLMSAQNPVMQSALSAYMDQSQKMFTQMQDQMQDQTYNLFGAFPFVPKSNDKK